MTSSCAVVLVVIAVAADAAAAASAFLSLFSLSFDRERCFALGVLCVSYVSFSPCLSGCLMLYVPAYPPKLSLWFAICSSSVNRLGYIHQRVGTAMCIPCAHNYISGQVHFFMSKANVPPAFYRAVRGWKEEEKRKRFCVSHWMNPNAEHGNKHEPKKLISPFASSLCSVGVRLHYSRSVNDNVFFSTIFVPFTLALSVHARHTLTYTMATCRFSASTFFTSNNTLCRLQNNVVLPRVV